MRTCAALTANGSAFCWGDNNEYAVALFTTTGERSERSNTITVNTERNTSDMDTGYTPVFRPLSPTNLNVINYSSTEVELFWDRPTTVPADFNGYEIWRNHTFIAFTRGFTFYDNSVRPGTYHYNVVPVSRDGSIYGFAGIDAVVAGN